MLAVAVSLTSLILTGCASLDARLTSAAQAKGKASAGIDIGRLPDDCYVTEAHAPLLIGPDARSILKRERAALDRQNARTIRCADFFDDLAEHLAAGVVE